MCSADIRTVYLHFESKRFASKYSSLDKIWLGHMITFLENGMLCRVIHCWLILLRAQQCKSSAQNKSSRKNNDWPSEPHLASKSPGDLKTEPCQKFIALDLRLRLTNQIKLFLLLRPLILLAKTVQLVSVQQAANLQLAPSRSEISFDLRADIVSREGGGWEGHVFDVVIHMRAQFVTVIGPFEDPFQSSELNACLKKASVAEGISRGSPSSNSLITIFAQFVNVV